MQNRRDFLKVMTGAASALALPSLAGATGETTKPNIVYILADDMGYGDLNCQNHESKIPTPNLDRLAKQGMRFTDAHSPSAVCTPTRYSTLTGRYCWRTRLKKSVLWPWDKPLIEEGRLTVPAVLKQQGYDTACVGKWHLGWDWPTKDGKKPKGNNVDFTKPIGGGPLAAGFDYYFGDDVPNFPPYIFIENDRTLGIPSAKKPQDMFGHNGPMLPGWELDNVMPAVTDKAVEYIEDEAGKDDPFFLFFTLTAPHTPIVPLEKFEGKSEAGRYGDYVYQVDHTVGRIMHVLKKSGIADNTLLVFTSDNGSPGRDGENDSGEKQSVVRRYGHDPSGPWRGQKGDIWEAGHRVPFIVRWPGHVPAAAVNDEIICQVDLMATLAGILGIELPAAAAPDSYDIMPAFEGRKMNAPIREATIHHSAHGLFAIRQGKWKLVDGMGAGGFSGGIRKPKEGDPAGQLYNLEADPAEQNNLYAQHPEVVQRLKSLLEKYKRDGRSMQP